MSFKNTLPHPALPYLRSETKTQPCLPLASPSHSAPSQQHVQHTPVVPLRQSSW